MRMIVVFAAVAAAIAGASAASAHDRTGGHWQWTSRPAAGPRSGVPSPSRVWVKDRDTRTADCNCAMMKADTSGCMIHMPGKDRSPSAS